jgi:hypothetical protein
MRKPIRKATRPARSAAAGGRGIDLAPLFKAAGQALAADQSGLNRADRENQNHGDNMVEVFSMISKVLSEKKAASPAAQLKAASRYVAKNSQSGSAQVYAQGLAQAAQQLKGRSGVSVENAMSLVTTLLGGGQAASAQGASDLLGALLAAGQRGPGGAGVLPGGEYAGTTPGPASQGSGLDLGDVLNAGLTFMNAKQQGQGGLEAVLTSLMSAGPMAQSPHRQQSGQLVAQAMLQALGSMADRR